MEKAVLYTLMAICMKDIGIMIKQQDRASTCIWTDVDT
jgi:hypothetical protein